MLAPRAALVYAKALFQEAQVILASMRPSIPARSVSSLVALALVAAAPAGAQQGPGAQPTASQRQAAALDLPEMTMMGTVDPHVRKATAIVNGSIITDTDVDHRLALVMIANSGRVSDEEKQVLRLQVLRNLIDEMLQIQEAGENEVNIPQSEVDQAYNRVASNFRQTPDQFAVYLRQGGTAPDSIKQQIRAELAWNRLLRRRVEPFVNVGDDEVQSIIRKLEESKGQDEFRVGEIFLSATPELQGQVMADAQRIVEQVRSGASFVAYARQFSEASTAAVGGDLGVYSGTAYFELRGTECRWVPGRPERPARQIRPRCHRRRRRPGQRCARAGQFRCQRNEMAGVGVCEVDVSVAVKT